MKVNKEVSLSPTTLAGPFGASILLAGLKLLGILDLSWWFVTLPLWITPLIGSILLLLITIWVIIFGGSFDAKVDYTDENNQ